MQAALNTAMQRVNKLGGVQGHPVRLITYDSAGVPRQGALFAERLITLDCASVIVGLYHNNVALAVSDVADRYGVPLILAGPHADALTANQRATVFRIAPAQTMLDRKSAEWLTAVADSYPDVFLNDGELTVVIVAENRQHERDAAERASFWLRQAGFAVEPIFVDLPTQDYSSTIARIVTLDMFPDVIINHLQGQPALDFHRQLLDAGIAPARGTIVVDDELALDDQAFWAVLPDGVGTVVSRNSPWGAALTEPGCEFATEYQQMYGHRPTAYAFAAYDAFLLAADALDRTATPTFPNLVDTLETSSIPLASGRYTFPYGSTNPPANDSEPNYLWHQWSDPPLLFLEYVEPQQSSADMPVLWPPSRRTAAGPYLLP
jgi:branched-chain amino acid transport system substrate-binding protein